jgi:hypothetical protein
LSLAHGRIPLICCENTNKINNNNNNNNNGPLKVAHMPRAIMERKSSQEQRRKQKEKIVIKCNLKRL